MNAALGRGGVLLAFVSALGGIALVAYALSTGQRRLLEQVTRFVAFVAGGAVLAFAAMERALITRDFSLEFVAEHGSSRTPALYNFATLWSALEGSILLWGLILAGYLVAVTREVPRPADRPARRLGAARRCSWWPRSSSA